jgi:hypothetical protein
VATALDVTLKHSVIQRTEEAAILDVPPGDYVMRLAAVDGGKLVCKSGAFNDGSWSAEVPNAAGEIPGRVIDGGLITNLGLLACRVER